MKVAVAIVNRRTVREAGSKEKEKWGQYDLMRVKEAPAKVNMRNDKRFGEQRKRRE